MAISFQCPWCHSNLEVNDSLAGKGEICPKCQARLQVPTQSEALAPQTAVAPTVSPLPAQSGSGSEIPIRFQCPACGKRLKASEHQSGQQAKCSRCGAVVRIPDEPSFDELPSLRLNRAPTTPVAPSSNPSSVQLHIQEAKSDAHAEPEPQQSQSPSCWKPADSTGGSREAALPESDSGTDLSGVAVWTILVTLHALGLLALTLPFGLLRGTITVGFIGLIEVCLWQRRRIGHACMGLASLATRWVPALLRSFSSNGSRFPDAQPAAELPVPQISPGRMAPVEVMSVQPPRELHVHKAPRPANSMGIASLVLGIIGLLFICLPFIGGPLAGLGLLLAIIGFLTSLGRRGSGIGYAIAGGALCAIGLIPGALLFVGIKGAIGGALKPPLSARPQADVLPPANATAKKPDDPPLPDLPAPISTTKGQPRDDVELFISKYGPPDTDDSTEYDKPRPPFVTRWLIYEPEHVKALYIPDGVKLGDPPPYKRWKLIGFTDSGDNHVLRASVVVDRLKSRKRE